MITIEDKLKGRSILIVDDDDRNLYALSCYLEAMVPGMTVYRAPGGQEAICILEKHQDIALVLMDIMMSRLDGYETIKRIRSCDKLKHLPVIAVTALVLDGDRDRCLLAGASDYVSKPIDTEQLLKSIAGALNLV
ncbi:MAG TPA: response regulator [Puia sp.]|jgi:CheY-like chemotaxis protein|nr:response regulator [Puia sp.]